MRRSVTSPGRRCGISTIQVPPKRRSVACFYAAELHSRLAAAALRQYNWPGPGCPHDPLSHDLAAQCTGCFLLIATAQHSPAAAAEKTQTITDCLRRACPRTSRSLGTARLKLSTTSRSTPRHLAEAVL